MLKDCLRFATQEDNQVSIKEFFEDEINYKACLEAAPDIVYADDYLLMQEQEAFRQNREKYEIFHKEFTQKKKQGLDIN